MAESVVVGSLRVLLSMNTAEFSTALREAQSSIQSWSRDMERIGQRMTTIGTGLTKALTLPIAAIGTVATKSAMDFESSFAGVRKTVDATDAEFVQMAQAFRDLAKEIPVNVNELNRLGEAAGALGIPKAEIVDFARVMAELGVTTNVTADQAAESIAKIQNIFGAAGQNTEQFASTLVALGNAGASTEAEILEMATRIAGAGSTIGLTQGQVLGFASALSSVGLQAEAGGTAISRVFIDMASSVSAGGERLHQFAAVAGMSAQEFARRFKEDAGGAVLAFIEGLGRIKNSGGDLIGTLTEMDIKEVRLRDALLRAAGAGDLMRESLVLQSKAWNENSALTEEARKRFKTTESQLGLLWNRIKDVAITFGNALLPVIEKAIKALDTFIPILEKIAQWFGKLPIGMQTTIVALAGLAAAVGPVLVVAGTLISTFSAVLPVLTAVGASLAALATGPVLIIGAAIAGLTVIWMRWGDDITRVVTQTVNTVKHWLVSVWQSEIVQAVAGMIKAMVDFYVAAFTRIADEAAKFIGLIRDWLVTKFDPIVRAVQPVLNVLRGFWDAAKNAILGIAGQLYEGIKTWLIDKFKGIVDSLKAMIDGVTDHFKRMKDLVVGKSYVPDMVNGIGTEFGRLDSLMVVPTKKSTQGVGELFESLLSSLRSKLPEGFKGIFDAVMAILNKWLGVDLGGWLSKLFGAFGSTFGSIFGGGGGVSAGKGLLDGIVSTGLKSIGDFLIPGFGQILSSISGVVVSGLKKIGGFFKDLFGGPSADELAGREIVRKFEDNLSQMVSEMIRIEHGNETWKNTVVAIRDAYMAAGLTEQDALNDAARLWASSRDGAEASRRIVEEITRKMQGFGAAIRGAFNEFPDEVRIPVRFDVGDLILPEIPQMATGGIVRRPTLAIIGESGPEAVVPLNARGGFGGGSAELANLVRRIEGLIDRLEHTLPIAIRDAMLTA